MKTREEIEKEYQNNVEILYIEFGDNLREVAEVRDAALAELDDPMARLIAAAKDLIAPTRWARFSHWGGDSLHSPTTFSVRGCSFCDAYAELRDAINYAEQRRALETRVAE